MNKMKDFTDQELIDELVRRGAKLATYGPYQEYQLKKKYVYDRPDGSNDIGKILILPSK